MRVILSHRQVDFDALASMLGVYILYPESVMILDGKPSPYVQEFLSLSKDLLPLKSNKDIDLNHVRNIVLVDTHDISRSSFAMDIMKTTEIKVEIIDHHPFEGILEPGMLIEPVGACATLLVEKISLLGIPINSFEATLLALGIYDDTGSLLFENTTVRDVLAVAFLLENGAQLNVISEYLKKPLTDLQKGLLQELVESGQIYTFQGTSVYITVGESKEYIGGLALLAHRIGELEGANTWFLVVKMENRVYITGRSKSEGLAVNKIVKKFGGSGHPKAASASIKNGNIEEILETLKSQILKHLGVPIHIKDVMTRNVRSVSPETNLSEVQQILLRYGHTGVPVVDNAVLVGIISRRDVEKALKHGLGHAPVKGFMSSNVITLNADASWEEAHRLMVEHDIGRLPIIENGQIQGIVSRSDILRLVHGGAVPVGTELLRARSSASRDDILNLIAKLPQELQVLLHAARDVCHELRCKAFIVGGFVRDLILDAHTQDIDLVIEGERSSKFAQALIEYLGEGELSKHPRFGTARISLQNGNHLDVAATRWEFYPFPGALPEVEESCLREDLFRRDFTINAMAISLEVHRFGELVDYYGGLRDIKQGEIHFLHRLSFIDDPTRILRAIRFASRYNFKIAFETRKGILTALDTGVLKNLSKERFTEELFLILREENYIEMGKLICDFGILNHWFGEDYPWNFDGPKIENSPYYLLKRWLSITIFIKEEKIKLIIEHLSLTKIIKKMTLRFLDIKRGLIRTNSISDLDYYLANEPDWLIDLLALHQEFRSQLLNYKKRVEVMDSVVNGKVLMDLGIQEGPLIGEIMKNIRDAWLNGKINNRLEENQYLIKLIKHI